jgi:putative ABC transport system permease protein
LAVRVALGAGRFRIARELLAEGILTAGAASVLGLLLASWNNDLTRAGIPAVAMRIVPGLRQMRIDSATVLMTVAVSLAAGILCSLPAVFQLAHTKVLRKVNDLLRGARSGSGATPASNRVRNGLIVCELALVLVLLTGAGMMVKAFQRMTDLNQGFDPKNLLTMRVALPAADYGTATQETSFYRRALQSFAPLPKVTASGLSSGLGPAEHFYIEGREEAHPGEPLPDLVAIGGEYLQAMRIPLVEGRSIGERDAAGAPRVAVISQSVARHYWPHAEPIGHRVKFSAASEWLTVVGVSGDVVDDWFRGDPAPQAYLSYQQFPSSHARFLLRTPGNPMEAAPDARRQLRDVDNSLPVYEVKTMEQAQFEQRAGVRMAATTMKTYALIALLLAVTGIYAVMAYYVAARTHDIGVRLALGATSADVLRMTMGQTARLTFTGLAIGVPLAVLLAKVMSSALYNVVNIEPATFAAFAIALTLAAAAASYVPARRATRIDPLSALRDE